ncbi:MAG: hypothetical protein RL180_606 [Pseudomonadota bacterium]|jgi:uncharacterized protein (TIGR02449 family)
MLVELQRLQALIETLTRQLQDARLQNEALAAQPKVNPADQGLRQELTQAQNRLRQIEQEHGILNGRYESLALAHQTISTEMERLASELAQQALARQQLAAERDALLQKNDHAKRKVEAIIQRLASLGQPTPADTEHHA